MKNMEFFEELQEVEVHSFWKFAWSLFLEDIIEKLNEDQVNDLRTNWQFWDWNLAITLK